MPPKRKRRAGGEMEAKPAAVASTDADPQQPQRPRPRRKRFVLFGDSITQQSFAQGGWGARLADAYARRADVVLRGYSGYNTEWALPLIPEVFLPPESGSRGGGGGRGAPRESRRPNALVAVFFGANDAALPDRQCARQHVPLARFKENLRKIAEAARETVERGGTVLLISCPPVGEEARARKLGRELAGPQAFPGSSSLPLPERTNEAARMYAEAACEVAESFSGKGEKAEEEKKQEKEEERREAARRGGSGEARRAAAPTARAASAAREAPPRVAFLNLWEALEGSGSPVATARVSTARAREKRRRRYLSDGLHLSELGNSRVFREVKKAIAKHCPHLRAEYLPLEFPDHSTLEPCPR